MNEIMVCKGSRVPVLPVRISGRRVQDSTRKPEVADDIMYRARVHIHAILRMPTQCVREEVHCGVTMETFRDRVPVTTKEFVKARLSGVKSGVHKVTFGWGEVGGSPRTLHFAWQDNFGTWKKWVSG